MVANVSAITRTSGVFLLLLATAFAGAEPGFIDRDEVEPGVYAVLRNGQAIFLECSPPSGKNAQPFLEKYLADTGSWKMYADKGAIAILFDRLSPEAKRQVLLTLFPLDYIDEAGWWHTVRFASPDCAECLAALATWLTGSQDNATRICSHKQNRGLKDPLKRGDRILIPQPLLLPVMKTFKAPPAPPEVPSAPATKEIDASSPASADDASLTPGIAFPFVNGNAEGLLEYRGEGREAVAEYRLRQGESLYSAVVVRFTDFRENKDILEACDVIAKRSSIRDVHCIRAGQKILIPVDMLSDRFQPSGSEERREYESIRAEEQRLTQNRVGTKDLEGVVVILDSGHGGRDQGAAVTKVNLYEDEINYDIVCRIKNILETQTQAKVYTTVLDPQQGYTPTEVTRFTHDTHEVLKTTPTYNNQDGDTSVMLRWHLANDIYYRERDRGVDDRNILFASIHCDSLFNETLRGAMVYVPGTKYRSDPSPATSAKYNNYAEVKRTPAPKTTLEQRRRDEALSRIFASTVLNSMRTNNPPLKVHDAGDPIRHVIRQSKNKAYLPAVLRYNVTPTKVLIEVANMTNPQDQQRLADPQWRQWFAEAFVNALRSHYSH